MSDELCPLLSCEHPLKDHFVDPDDADERIGTCMTDFWANPKYITSAEFEKMCHCTYDFDTKTAYDRFRDL